MCTFCYSYCLELVNKGIHSFRRDASTFSDSFSFVVAQLLKGGQLASIKKVSFVYCPTETMLVGVGY